MSEQSIARRYAKAIFELALESGTPDLVRDNLTLARDAIARTPEFCAGLLSPEVPRQEKRQLVEKFISAAAFLPMVANAIRLLAERQRLQLLPDIAEIYGALLDAHRGVLHCRLTSAEPLDRSDMAAISVKLERRFGQSVVIDAAVDPSLIGGLTAEIAGKTMDSSVRGQLQALGHKLRSA